MVRVIGAQEVELRVDLILLYLGFKFMFDSGHKFVSAVHDIPDLWRRVNNPYHWFGRGRIFLLRCSLSLQSGHGSVGSGRGTPLDGSCLHGCNTQSCPGVVLHASRQASYTS